MTVLCIAAIFGLIAWALAYRANVRLGNAPRLPMQWWLNGEVTWSAPRRVALAFIPALTTAVLAFFVVLSMTLPPRAGQEAQLIPTLLGIGATLIAAQLLHLWLVKITLNRNAG